MLLILINLLHNIVRIIIDVLQKFFEISCDAIEVILRKITDKLQLEENNCELESSQLNFTEKKKFVDKHVLLGKNKAYIFIEGQFKLNLASHNYLLLSGDKRLEIVGEKCIRKYGVGFCGSRGFSRALLPHSKLEKNIAHLFQKEESIIYSCGFSTIFSVIAAYIKKNCTVFVDEMANHSIKLGVQLSKADVFEFKHNDSSSLKILLDNVSIPSENKWLIIEGVYSRTGKICKLPELVELANNYKLRIIIDESISFGVLGEKGRGVTEHYNISTSTIDLISGSFQFALGSIGGFCVGSSHLIQHQRLSSLEYCFSEYLPPLFAVVVIKNLSSINRFSNLLKFLKNISISLHTELHSNEILNKYFCLISCPESPVKCLISKNKCRRLTELKKKCFESNLLINHEIEENEESQLFIRLCVNVNINLNNIKYIVTVLEKSILEIYT